MSLLGMFIHRKKKKNRIGESKITYFFWSVPILYAITIILLTAASTGIISAKQSAFQYTDLMTPLPVPTNTPIGPFRLSTQPGSGSLKAGVTNAN